MEEVLPQKLINLAKNCPFPLYLVGGRVRDYLAGLTPDVYDTDICAPVDAESFVAVAEKCGFKADAVYKSTGTVKLSDGENGYEFASFRSDVYVRGEHSPVKTFFTDDISLDAKRRDFKCNAVYYDIKKGEFIDPLGGIEDIKNRRLSTVAAADKVFGEDGLRLMRLARISAQTGFEPTEECLEGAKANARLIGDVKAERVFCELDAILHADLRYGRQYAQLSGLEILKDIGVFKEILPELYLGNGMKQREDIHKYDVLEHSFRTVAYAAPQIRLAALLHDVGKPYCMKNYGNYHMHEAVGAQIAPRICARLRVSKRLTEQVCDLVALHMYDFRCDAKISKVRKFIVKHLDRFDELMMLKQADYSACADDLSPAPSVVKMQGVLFEMKEKNLPLKLKDLDIRGDDLYDAGCPKEMIGKTLESLLYACVCGQTENRREKLLNYARKVAFNC